MGLSDLPGLLAVHEQTPRKWRERGVLPEPDGVLGGSPRWWRSGIVVWWAGRHRHQEDDGAS